MARVLLIEPSAVSYLALWVRVAMPVKVGEGPSSTSRSKLNEMKRRSWVSIQRTGEANW